MLKNTYVRIAVAIVAVILLYYLVVTLGRSAAGADDARMSLGGSEWLERAAPTRGAMEPR